MFRSISNARQELPRLVESPEATVIVRNNDPVAVLLPVDEYRALVAARELAREPGELAAVEAAYARAERGDLTHAARLELEAPAEWAVEAAERASALADLVASSSDPEAAFYRRIESGEPLDPLEAEITELRRTLARHQMVLDRLVRRDEKAAEASAEGEKRSGAGRPAEAES